MIAIDLGEEKLKAALDFRSTDLADSVRSVAPRGVAVAVDLVGARETLTFSLGLLGRRGRLVLLTTFPGIQTAVSPRDMVHRELAILGSRYASRREVLEAASLVATGRITPVVSEVVPLARVADLHATLRAGALLGRGAIAFPEG